jgi:hypothetical protein
MIRLAFLVLFLVSVGMFQQTAGDPKDKPVKNVLAFGGNGFIGK